VGGTSMGNESIIKEAVKTRGEIYDIIKALIVEHGIEMILSVLEDICFIQATSLKIHKKNTDEEKYWDHIGKQITQIKLT
jgi:hypothetical protein